METNHTPTPWKVMRKVMTGRYWIEASDETTIATILDPMNSKEVEANAAFIVRAVNAHEELLKALKEQHAVVCDDAIGGWEGYHNHPEEPCLICPIIAKAEGK